MSRIRDLDVVGFVTKHTFVFSLILASVLLAVNLSRSSSFQWTSHLASFAPVALAAMASTPAIISGRGGFDLSISPLMVLTTGVYAVWLLPNGLGGPVSILFLLALGAGVGAANGLLVILLRVPPVAATLSTFFILIGVNLIVLSQPRYMASTWMRSLAGSIGPVPAAVLTIGLPLLAWTALRLTPYVRTLYAVGSGDEAAFSSGINVGAVRVIAYAIGGTIAAVGGVAIVAVTSTANAGVSQTYTLQAIAAVALGGTSLWGGRGGLAGSLLGAASLYLAAILLISFNLSPNLLQVLYGGMLLLAIIAVGGAARVRRVT